MQTLAATHGRCPIARRGPPRRSTHVVCLDNIKAPCRPQHTRKQACRLPPLAAAAASSSGQATPTLTRTATVADADSSSRETPRAPVLVLDAQETAAGTQLISSVVPFRSPSRQGGLSDSVHSTQHAAELIPDMQAATAERQQQQTVAAAGAAAAVSATAEGVHSVLGTSAPLEDIKQVVMQLEGRCKMGISFWPLFTFSPPAREREAGTCHLLPPAAAAAASQPPAEATSATAGANGGSVPSSTAAAALGPEKQQQQGGDRPLAAAAGVAARRLLAVNFTQDPPDEFRVGANFLGGIPFPFIAIRTSKLEGTVDCDSGAVVLDFQAQFLCGVGSGSPTALTVDTQLTSEPATALGVTMVGQRLRQGACELVAAATVPKTGYWLADLLLWLPTAAVARLPMRLRFMTDTVTALNPNLDS